jgi:hypothetical protein
MGLFYTLEKARFDYTDRLYILRGMNEKQPLYQPIEPDMEAHWQKHQRYGKLLMRVAEKQLDNPELSDDMKAHWQRYSEVGANKIARATDALHTLELGRLALDDEQ